MQISDEMGEAFGNAFWSVNAASKIDGQRDHIRSALEAALSTAAEPVAFVVRHDLENGGGSFCDERNGIIQDHLGHWQNADVALYAEPVKTAPAVAVSREEMAELLFATDWPNDKWDRFKDGDHAKERYLRMADAALSAQVQDVAGWQPIETAPKDGTVILGGHEAAVITVWWEADGSQNNTGEPGWIDGAFNSVEENYTYPVTHWMPLPVFPASPASKHGDAE